MIKTDNISEENTINHSKEKAIDTIYPIKKAMIQNLSHPKSADAKLELPQWYEVRKATIDDIEDLYQVRKEARKETYKDLDKEFIEERFVGKYQNIISKAKIEITEGKAPYVATYQWKIIGMKYLPWYDPDRGAHRIGGIYILEEHHHKWLGTMLMQESLKDCNKDLILWVEKGNSNAIKFYKWLWFVEDPTLEHDYELGDGQKMRTIWMKRLKNKT
jgi:ribosomal protein S18 acetylase RimI-like enzyme